MIYFNLEGLLFGLLALAPAAAIYYARGVDEMILPLMTWLASVALGASLYDKLPSPGGLRAYATWFKGSDARLAVLGPPLVFWPLAGAIFGAAFPAIDGDPLPAWWFFGIALVTPVALLVVRARSG